MDNHNTRTEYKKKSSYVNIIFGILAASFVITSVQNPFSSEKDVLVVGSIRLKESDMQKRIHETYATMSLSSNGYKPTSNAVYDEMITQILLDLECQNLGINVSTEYAQKSLMGEPAFQENAQYSEKLLQKFLMDSRLSLTQMIAYQKRKVCRDLLKQAVMRSLKTPKVFISLVQKGFAQERAGLYKTFDKREIHMKPTSQDIKMLYESDPAVLHLPQVQHCDVVFFRPNSVVLSEEDKEKLLADTEVQTWIEKNYPEFSQENHASFIKAFSYTNDKDNALYTYMSEKKSMDMLREKLRNVEKSMMKKDVSASDLAKQHGEKNVSCELHVDGVDEANRAYEGGFNRRIVNTINNMSPKETKLFINDDGNPPLFMVVTVNKTSPSRKMEYKEAEPILIDIWRKTQEKNFMEQEAEKFAQHPVEKDMNTIGPYAINHKMPENIPYVLQNSLFKAENSKPCVIVEEDKAYVLMLKKIIQTPLTTQEKDNVTRLVEYSFVEEMWKSYINALRIKYGVRDINHTA